MATSPVQIVNSALILIGAEPINSLSDTSKSAKIANRMYDLLRKEVLLSHPWNFAVARKELSATVNTPEYDYAYEYTLPSDVLRVLDTNLPIGEPWEIGLNPATGDKVLMTDSSSIKIKYIKDLTDTTLFTPTFEQALAARMAAHFAYSLVQSASLQQNMYAFYKDLLSSARSFDAQEMSNQELEANEWLDVRS